MQMRWCTLPACRDLRNNRPRKLTVPLRNAADAEQQCKTVKIGTWILPVHYATGALCVRSSMWIRIVGQGSRRVATRQLAAGTPHLFLPRLTQSSRGFGRV